MAFFISTDANIAVVEVYIVSLTVVNTKYRACSCSIMIHKRQSAGWFTSATKIMRDRKATKRGREAKSREGQTKRNNSRGAQTERRNPQS